MENKFIDVSELEAPAPFYEIIKILKTLQDGEILEVKHRLKTQLLYKTLNENGYFHKTYEVFEGYKIMICHGGDIENIEKIEALVNV